MRRRGSPSKLNHKQRRAAEDLINRSSPDGSADEIFAVFASRSQDPLIEQFSKGEPDSSQRSISGRDRNVSARLGRLIYLRFARRSTPPNMGGDEKHDPDPRNVLEERTDRRYPGNLEDHVRSVSQK